MKLLFNLRVLLWSIVAELEYYLYPYKTTDPEIDQFYMVKDEKTGERYSIVEWMKIFDDKLDSIEDNYCFLMSEMRKVNKLDADVLELKNQIYKRNEKNLCRCSSLASAVYCPCVLPKREEVFRSKFTYFAKYFPL